MSNDTYVQSIVDAKLSPVTKRVYLQRLKVMMETLEMTLEGIITNPEIVITWIHETYKSEQTRKSYISAVLAVYRHSSGLKEREQENYKRWYEAFATVHGVIEDRYKRNEPTQKQKDIYVPFPEIIKLRDTLPRGSYERLLLAFYTYLPPLRCDFNRIYIHRGDRNADSLEPNYITYYGNERCGNLVLNEYKTQKGKNSYEKGMPQELCDELATSLEKNPRDWLFIDKNNKPFTAKSYTQWANRVLARVLGKRMTVSMLRHSFINSLDFNTLTVAEKEEIAKDMAHTVGTQDRYRLIFH